MAKIYSKEWNGTLIEVKNESNRAELIINGRTVDFIKGYFLKVGENDYMHGYDGENHVEVRLVEKGALIFKHVSCEFYYNGRKIYECSLSPL